MKVMQAVIGLIGGLVGLVLVDEVLEELGETTIKIAASIAVVGVTYYIVKKS